MAPNIQEIRVKQTGAEKAAGGLNKVDRSIAGLTTSALAYAAAAGAILVVAKKLITSYGVQEAAEIKLRTALGHTNKSLLDQASAFQKQSKYGDEALISMMALASNMGIAENQISETTRMAIGLATALNVDMNMAMKAAAGAIQGDTNMLTRYIPLLKTTTDQSKKLAIVQEAANKGFQQSIADTKSMAGSMQQASMAIGDAGEALGKSFAEPVKLAALGIQLLSENLGNFIVVINQVDAGTLTVEQRLSALQNLMAGQFTMSAQQANDEFIRLGLGAFDVSNALYEWDRVQTELNETMLLANASVERQVELVAGATAAIREQSEAVSGLVQLYPELGAVGASAADIQVSSLEKLNLLTSTVKDSLGGLGQTWMQLAQMGGASNKTMFEVGKAASIASASINTYEAATKAYASAPPPFNFINAALVTAAGLAQVAMIKGTTMKAATGADFTTNGPQMLLVGDNRSGKERVQVTPLGGDPNLNGPQGGTTFNFYGDVIGTDQFVRDSLIPKIKNAMRLGHA